MTEQNNSEYEKRKKFIEEWTRLHKDDVWTVIFSKTEKKPHQFDQNKWLKDYKTSIHQKSAKAEQQGEAIAEPPNPPSGRIIYTPQNCPFPDAWNTPIGTIWECGEYHEGRDGQRCYDQWIVVAKGGSRHWEIFKRNI